MQTLRSYHQGRFVLTPVQNNSLNWASENGFGLQFGKIWSREKWSQRKALTIETHVLGALSENFRRIALTTWSVRRVRHC